HCLTCRQDAGLQGRIANELIGPQVRDELILQHHPIAVCDQVSQQVKDLGPQRDPHAGPAQLVACSIKTTVTKQIAHGPFALHARAPATTSSLQKQSLIVSRKCHQNNTKVSPRYHAFLSEASYLVLPGMKRWFLAKSGVDTCG